MNLVANKLFHSATGQLLRNQFLAKLTKIASSFSNPRRKVLAIVALLLGGVWLFQAIASVLFRQSADPAKLMLWLPLGLLAYSLWHVIKISTRKPVEPFEWTPAEKEYICAAPISRTQLISYRLASIVSTAAIKALCFSIVMIPDLNIWLFGLVGMFLGLLLVDLIRVSYELLFNGLSKSGQWICRLIVVGTAIASCGWALAVCLTSPDSAENISSPGALIFFEQFLRELTGLSQTSIGSILLMPFQPFAQFILADKFNGVVAGFGILSATIVIAMSGIVYQLDRWSVFRTGVKEQASFTKGKARCKLAIGKLQTKLHKVSVPWKLGGFGSLAWRQLLGAYHYRMTVLFSLAIPTALSCISLLADHNPFVTLLNVVGSLSFYSFLLLPSALILDFRRDVDRISVLKSLPISPIAVTAGQLAAPVLLAWAFQWTVLLIAIACGKVIFWQAIMAAVLFLPLNVLIFALENFVFLLSPYRRNKEGIDVFLRTILTFTAKGIFFAFGLACFVGWAFGSSYLCGYIGYPSLQRPVFAVGAWTLIFTVANIFVLGTTRLYSRLDPSDVVCS